MMTNREYRIGIVGASSLVGKELSEELGASSLAASDFVLLDEEDAAGQLTAAADEAQSRAIGGRRVLAVEAHEPVRRGLQADERAPERALAAAAFADEGDDLVLAKRQVEVVHGVEVTAGEKAAEPKVLGEPARAD